MIHAIHHIQQLFGRSNSLNRINCGTKTQLIINNVNAGNYKIEIHATSSSFGPYSFIVYCLDAPHPTTMPSISTPSLAPTTSPSNAPTSTPSLAPTTSPSNAPTDLPFNVPCYYNNFNSVCYKKGIIPSM